MKYIKKLLYISNHPIKEFGRVFIIAEAGVNHNGRLDLALQLVDIAAAAGADAIKFQTFKAEGVVRKNTPMAKYQKDNVTQKSDQYDLLKGLELPDKFYPKIIKRCQEKNILFLSTPHGGRSSVNFLKNLDVKAYKIGSADLTNYVLLKLVAETKRPIIISSGMSTLKEIQDAILFIQQNGNFKIIVLHCTTNYPCPLDEVNLKAMTTLMKALNVPVGYSDHTEGNTVAIMATTLGACVYECHFTLDKNLPGPDHIASVNPKELFQRVKAIRSVEIILGSDKKKPTNSEKTGMRSLVRKSIVASKDLKAGHIITFNDLDATRPHDGIAPNKFTKILGKKLRHKILNGHLILFRDLYR